MSLIVQKYGGTSVGSVDKIKNVAKKVIATRDQGNQVVVVVSAMGKTTDDYISLMKQVSGKTYPREYDQLISTGENISAALLAMAISDQGAAAISLTGWQAGVFTEDVHMKGKICGVDSTRINQELVDGKIVIVTGFQGVNSTGDITTIGRSGSDTSAVVIAAAIKADVCEIYTDVDGIYTTDPRMVPSAKRLETISHEEMLELASLGAGVMHPRAVETGKVNGMNIDVKHAHKDLPGTRIMAVGENSRAVSGVAEDDNIAKIAVLYLPDQPGVAAELFNALAQSRINVDVIVQSTHETINKNDISFTICRDDYDNALEVVNALTSKWPGVKVSGEMNVSKVSIVGTGMVSTPGVAAKMFEVLGKIGVNIQMISTSEIKVSCIVDADSGSACVNAVHDAFELGKTI